MSILNAITKTANIPYLTNVYIREYDISKANINILYREGYLDDTQYEYYLKADRNTRQYDLGMMQKSKEVSNALSNGLKRVRQEFIQANGILEEDVLSIKNDAFYLINKIPTITRFDNVEFIHSETYTSFYSLNGLELYYYYDSINMIEKLDVKGISNDMLTLHENHFIEFLKVIFASVQVDGVKEAIDVFLDFYDNYINKKVNINYYRTFDSDSSFIINIDTYGETYRAYIIDQTYINYIDITCNLHILRNIYSHLTYMDLYN